MGFLDNYGGGANAFANNFMNVYQNQQQFQLEREKMLQAKAVQEAQMKEYAAQTAEREQATAEKGRLAANDVEYQKGYDALYAPTQQPGLMSDEGPNPPRMVPGDPSIEQLLNLQGKYSPDKAMASRVSMANTEANTASREKIRDLQSKNELEKLGLRQDQAQKLFEVTQDNKFKIAADKAASDMAIVMERMQGIKDVASMKVQDPSAKLDFEASKTLLRTLPKLKDDATIAANSIQTMKTMVDHIAAGDAGAVGRLKGALAPYAEALGYSSKSMSDAQAYQLLAKTISGSMRMAIVGPGQVSNYETQLLQSISGGGNTAKEASKALFKHYSDQARLKVDSYNRDVESLAEVSPKGGKMFPKIKIPGEDGSGGRTVTRTGTDTATGEKITEWSDGSVTRQKR